MNFFEKTAEIIPIDNVIDFLETPADSSKGDIAMPCFKLAATMKKAPNIIAQEIAGQINKPDFIEKIEVVGAYINFYLDKSFYAKNTLTEVFEKKEHYGESDIGEGKNVCMDYSSPNIAKPFHVGHLRSTVIGNALYNIYKAIGYNSIGINHLGDWGTQFGKLIVAYKLWGDKELVEKDGVTELTKIYVKFHSEAEKDESLNDEARAWLVKMQEGDEEALSLWKWFNDISLKEFNKIYDKLGIKFDYFTGESFYNDKMDAVVEELKEKDLLTKDDGAMIVDLEKYNMPPCLILRSDGGTLYPTRDISAAFYRKKEYNFAKSLYLTALDQNLHFAQWFKVIELMGYDWAKDLIHVPFGLVSLSDGKLSTRKGRMVLMEDLLNEAVEKAKTIIEEKNPDLENKDKISEDVGIGAVIFNDLYNSRIKNVTFDLEKMLNFEGETGPYVQYTHARATSILTKAGGVDFNIDFNNLTDVASIDVIKNLALFPDKIIEAADKNEPYILSRLLVNLCQSFNKFYHDNSILNAEEEVKKSRVALTYCVKTVICKGLSLLGINAPEKM